MPALGKWCASSVHTISCERDTSTYWHVGTLMLLGMVVSGVGCFVGRSVGRSVDNNIFYYCKINAIIVGTHAPAHLTPSLRRTCFYLNCESFRCSWHIPHRYNVSVRQVNTFNWQCAESNGKWIDGTNSNIQWKDRNRRSCSRTQSGKAIFCFVFPVAFSDCGCTHLHIYSHPVTYLHGVRSTYSTILKLIAIGTPQPPTYAYTRNGALYSSTFGHKLNDSMVKLARFGCNVTA